MKPGDLVRLHRHGDGTSTYRILGRARRGSGPPRWHLVPEPDDGRGTLNLSEEWLAPAEPAR